MDFCIHDDIVDTILVTVKKLLHFKLSKSGQILHIDETGFPGPSYVYSCNEVCKSYFGCRCIICLHTINVALSILSILNSGSLYFAALRSINN